MKNDIMLPIGLASTFSGLSQRFLREYSDKYNIPTHKTVNGHRRYKMADLQKFIDRASKEEQQ